jgi:hypothetical protein
MTRSLSASRAGPRRPRVSGLPEAPGFRKPVPVGYAESRGNFTLRLAQEMHERPDLRCEVDLASGTARQLARMARMAASSRLPRSSSGLASS